MASSAERLTGPDDRLKAVGLAIGGFGPFLVAMALVPLRGNVEAANAALALVVVVVLAAAFGGRASGTIAAVVATLCYDFFFTHPYGSLKIDRADDVLTTVLLLAIGLTVAEIVVLGYRQRGSSERRRDQVTRLHRIAELVAGDTETDDVLLAVRAELMALLTLRDCEFEAPPFDPALPEIGRRGGVEGGRRRWVGGELSLPADGAQILVYGRGRLYGRLVLVPSWDVGVSIEERLVAVALADELGMAMAADERPYRAGEGSRR